MLFTKTRFRPLLSRFITRFILIIIESVFGPTHFQPGRYITLLKMGRISAQNGLHH